jgi:hypothetical protein|nr:MAG TPA: hypothetical protein [Caudoviricetes sp.]
MSTEKKEPEHINGVKVIKEEKIDETVVRKYLENGMYVDIVTMARPLN